MRKLILILAALLIVGGVVWFWGTNNPKDASVMEIGIAAGVSYTYGYPLVLMDESKDTMLGAFNKDRELITNRFIHKRSFPDEDFRAVVRPSPDLIYSNAWLDLSDDPQVVIVPDMGERYYNLSIMDAWTNVFAAPGQRTTGTGPDRFLVVGPRWDGEKPDGMEVFSSPTDMAWILGRFQADDEKDLKEVHDLQDSLHLVPLQDYVSGDYDLPEPLEEEEEDTIKRPSHEVAEMEPTNYFNRLSRLMVDNPPADEDGPALEQLELLGLEPGEPLNQNDFGFIARIAINQGVKMARDRLKEAIAPGGPATQEGWGDELEEELPAVGSLGQVQSRNGWSVALEDIGSYGTNYAFRAGVALIGLGANLPEDAIYYNAAVDKDGNFLDANREYTIHFEADELPPADAFWSVAIYNEEGFLVANPLNRFHLSDRDPLVYNEDGSLTLYIQSENPGGEKEKNWLPAPETDHFTLTARLYSPREEALRGYWFMPPVYDST